MLLYEAKLLKHLEGGEGIANVYFSGKEGAGGSKPLLFLQGAVRRFPEPAS